MELPTRKQNRLENYDYSQNGAYFITICTNDRKEILSKIEYEKTPIGNGYHFPDIFQCVNLPNIVGDGLARPVVKLTAFGEIIESELLGLGNRFNNVFIDNYVIMPNHMHILMRLENQTGGASPSPTISAIICAFKSLSAKECKRVLNIDKLFQRSFYDHIIRDDEDYQSKWQYIDGNPANWKDDELYQDRI